MVLTSEPTSGEQLCHLHDSPAVSRVIPLSSLQNSGTEKSYYQDGQGLRTQLPLFFTYLHLQNTAVDTPLTFLGPAFLEGETA